MPIPDPVPETGFLPPGDWSATLSEVEDRFGTRPRRRRERFSDAKYVIEQLWERGATGVWIGGSFVTTKDLPRDVDVVFEAPAATQPDTWGIYSGRPAYRKMMQERHHVDLWRLPAYQTPRAGIGQRLTIKEFWEEKDGVAKGLVEVIHEPRTDKKVTDDDQE